MKIKSIVALMLAAVMLFSFTACKDEPEPDKEGTIYAGFDQIFEDEATKYHYIDNPEAFMRAAQYELKIDETTAGEFLSDTDNWKFYSLNIVINNNMPVNHTFVGFAASEMPDGIWLSNISANGELSVPANVTDQQYPASVLVDTRKVNITEMYKAIAELDVNVLYYETPADETEVSESDYKKLKVTNSIVVPEEDNVKPEEQISAKRTTIEDGSSFLETYRTNSIAFSNEAKLFGLDSETAAEVIATDSAWQWYTLYIEIENKTAEELNVNKIIAADNGANGVWVCNVSQYGEFGMPANDKQELPVSVLVDTSELDGKSAQEAISEMNIQLEYIAGATIDDEGNESVLPSKTVDVK
ncbi:MAG: hypothetical protein IJA87_01275 [Clostridia bacterium]|nr:hypothetical protein [Clostridia bacterium]